MYHRPGIIAHGVQMRRHMNLEQLEAEALRLDPQSRAWLAERLFESLVVLANDETERAWLDEALARDAELEAGEVTSRPADEVLREVRSRLK
jgi:hypothetical protein